MEFTPIVTITLQEYNELLKSKKELVSAVKCSTELDVLYKSNLRYSEKIEEGLRNFFDENKILKEQLTKVKELLLRSSATTIMTELRETIESFK